MRLICGVLSVFLFAFPASKSFLAYSIMRPFKTLSLVPKVTHGISQSKKNLQSVTITAVNKNYATSNSYSSTKVVTDIDDTVKSSGGVRLFGIPLGGIDTQFRRGEFYPGAFQFAFELSTVMKNNAPENVAVLTARAKEFKFALALKKGDKICNAYSSVGKSNGFKEWG